MLPTLLTERLVLRPFHASDLNGLADLHAEESFWRYPLGRGQTKAETEAFLTRVLMQYSEVRIGVCAVIVADSGELAGWAGLSVPAFLPEILPAVEVGWRLGERYRGLGYSSEAGRAWVRFGFEERKLESIVSIYEPDNEASGRVMTKLGFTLQRETTHPAYGVPLHVMVRERSSWATG
jgi:RimJ/RimL family protein N-acetyltransferase